jgi:hypothetical protein
MSAKSPKLPNVLTVASAVEANCTKAAANRPRAGSAEALRHEERLRYGSFRRLLGTSASYTHWYRGTVAGLVKIARQE